MKTGLTIKEQVVEVLLSLLGTGIVIEDKTVVLNATGIDGNFQRDLVMLLEQELEVEIPDSDAEKLITVKDIVKYITKKKEVK